jgi:hypothetical protein
VALESDFVEQALRMLACSENEIKVEHGLQERGCFCS